MDGNHPKNADPRPKRRRDKDNPYELFTTSLGTDQPRYYLAFVDSTGIEQCMEIDKTLFDVFDRFELDDISFMNEVDRHWGMGISLFAAFVFSVVEITGRFCSVRHARCTEM